jgi:hypothetical protein
MVPKSIYVNTGDNSKVYEEISRFFVEIADRLEPKPLSRPSQIEIRLYNLGKEHGLSYLASDDKLHALLFQEEVIAAVTETRTYSNEIRFNFFENLSDFV